MLSISGSDVVVWSLLSILSLSHCLRLREMSSENCATEPCVDPAGPGAERHVHTLSLVSGSDHTILPPSSHHHMLQILCKTFTNMLRMWELWLTFSNEDDLLATYQIETNMRQTSREGYDDLKNFLLRWHDSIKSHFSTKLNKLLLSQLNQNMKRVLSSQVV